MRPLLVVALVLALAGCQESEDDRREAYCAEVRESAEEVSRTVEEGGSAAFVKVLPTLERLADAAPSDLQDEWDEFLRAVRRLRDAFEAAGVDPARVKDKLPADLEPAERKRIENAALALAAPGPLGAAQGIQQHARDICKTPIL